MPKATKRKRKRRYISLREKLAAALAELLTVAERVELLQRRVPAKSVIALFEQDHAVLHAFDGSDRWWNLTPMRKAAHREKSKRDTAIVAKAHRIDEKWGPFMAAQAAGRKPPKRPSRWPKRRMRQ